MLDYLGKEFWVCGDCGARASEPGDCNVCGFPRLDARQSDVRQMLINDDRRRKTKRFHVCFWPVLIFHIVLYYGVFVPTSLGRAAADLAGPDPSLVWTRSNPSTALIGLVVLVWIFFATTFLTRIFPAKQFFQYLRD